MNEHLVRALPEYREMEQRAADCEQVARRLAGTLLAAIEALTDAGGAKAALVLAHDCIQVTGDHFPAETRRFNQAYKRAESKIMAASRDKS